MKANSLARAAAVLLAIPTLSAQTATWTDGAAGQLLYSCGNGTDYHASNNHKWTQDIRYGSNCDGEGDSTIRDVSNWDIATYPDGTGIDVVINTGNPVELSNTIDIANLTIGSAGQINFNSHGILNVHGGTIQNDGLINLVDLGNSDASLKIHANTALNGSGTIMFNSNDDCYIESLSENEILTVGASQTLLAPAVAVAGVSNSKISAAMTNNGTITADEGGLLLDTFAKTNNNLIQAINGGTIKISGIAVDNTNGTITAGAGSTVHLDAVTLNAGLLNGPGLFTVSDNDATLTGNPTLAAGSTIELTANEQLTIDGTFTNNGEIRLNETGNSLAYLTINGNTTLAGSGRVLFASYDDNVINSLNPTDVLTVGPDQTLTTTADAIAGTSASIVMTALTNEGTITADQGGLRLDTNDKTNNSTMQAINGGLLQFSGITINNTNGTISADATSSITLDNTVINGGLISGPGPINLTNNDATFNTGTTIATDTVIKLNGYDILTINGTVTNNGTIELNDPGSGLAELVIDGHTTLNGSGQVLFQSYDDNVIDSTNPTDILTVGPGQTLVTSASAIGSSDASRVIAAMTNEGTVSADEGGLQLDTRDKTNNNLMQAVNGGKLRISGITIDNTNGTITADAASSIILDNATINGGMLDGEGTIDILTTDATFGGVTIGPDLSVDIRNYDILHLDSSITNNGRILLADGGSDYARLRINTSVTLDGSGEVVFNNSQDNVIDSADPAHVLTIGPDQNLVTSTNSSATWSDIQANVLNNGTITAATGGLKLSTNNKTNNSLIQTTGGGTLRCTGITIDNTGGTISLDAAGSLLMDGCTLSGGLLDGSGTVDVQTSDGTLANGITIGPDVSVTLGSYDILTLTDTVTNNGEILITDLSGGSTTLRISGPVSVEGSGRIVFNSYDDNILDSVNPGDVLTVGAAQTVTTSADSRVTWSILHAATVNNGLVEGNDGALSLRTNPKTNNSTFRATNGGELEVQAADTILTNYDSTTGTLTGGRWEVTSTDSASVMDLQGAAITTLAPGTEVVMTGPLSSFPALMLDTVSGSLAVNELQVLDLGETDLAIDGTLEFGLTDGATDGWDATRIQVDGNVDLTGSTLNITGPNITPGTYELIQWTGTLTGIPTLGSVPDGFSFSISADGDSLNLSVTDPAPAVPVILDIEYDAPTNTVTITYQSINGVIFGVLGSNGWEPPSRIFAPTEVGDGSIKHYQAQPPENKDAGPESYFFQFVNPAPEFDPVPE